MIARGQALGVERPRQRRTIVANLSTAAAELITAAATARHHPVTPDRRVRRSQVRRCLQPAPLLLPPHRRLAESGPLLRSVSDKKFRASPKPINEDGTHAFFIDRILDALGYSDFDEVEHGASQASGTFPDYILRAGNKRVIAVEAKRLGAPLGEMEAAQLVSYCSVVAVAWGVLTDGRHIHVYDPPVVGVPPLNRLVLQIDLVD